MSPDDPDQLLLVYSPPWIEKLETEWGALAEAAAHAGYAAVVTDWDSLVEGPDGWRARRARRRLPGEAGLVPMAEVPLDPLVILTPWGVDRGHRERFARFAAATRALLSESPLLDRVTGKAAFERMLRAFEAAGGASVPRPATRLWDELGPADVEPADEHVIVKPTRGGKCRGISIEPRAALAALAAEAAVGTRDRFIVQRLVTDVPLHRGRRWVARVYVVATALAPLRYRILAEGIAKAAGSPAEALPAPGTEVRLDAWLNASSFNEEAWDDVTLGVALAGLAADGVPVAGFADEVAAIVDGILRAIARAAGTEGEELGASFLLVGLDLILERTPDGATRVLVLEANSHPCMDWWHLNAALIPEHRRWMEDLRPVAAARRRA